MNNTLFTPAGELFGKFPLTVRSVLVLAFISYAAWFLAVQSFDVVATILAFTVLMVLIFIISVTVVCGLLVRRRVGCALIPPSGNDSTADTQTRLESGKRTTFVLKGLHSGILPLFQLIVRPKFLTEGIAFTPVAFLGNSRETRTVTTPLLFPHRGEWVLNGFNCTFGDQLGFSTLPWFIKQESVFTVFPPSTVGRPFPIITSSHRSGDDITDAQNRDGDLYDLKPYDPSDGAKRILWKVYAKRRELISRHPEPAMTPEGRVIVYSHALGDDDLLASESIAYVRRLEEAQLQINFSCAGAGDDDVTHTAEGAESLLVDTAWNAKSPAGFMGSSLLRMCQSPLSGDGDSRISTVVILCSQGGFIHPWYRESLVKIGDLLSSSGISPTYFFVKKIDSGTSSPHSRHRPIRNFFFSGATERPASSTDLEVGTFSTLCASRGWSVIAY